MEDVKWGETNTPVTNSVDTNSVVKSSDTVKNYIESKNSSNTITVTDKNVTSEQYLYLLTKSVTNINCRTKENTITIKSIAKALTPKKAQKRYSYLKVNTLT